MSVLHSILLRELLSERMIAHPGNGAYPLQSKAGRDGVRGPRCQSTVGIQTRAVVAGAACGRLWSAVRIKHGASLGPEGGEEGPELGEAAAGGLMAFSGREDGFLLGKGLDERRKKEGEG